MKFEVWEPMTGDKPVTIIEAVNEVNAWKILKKMGIRNRSKQFELIKVED